MSDLPFRLNNEPEGEEPATKPIDLVAGRRAFIGTLGLGALGTALLAPASIRPALAQAAGITDVDVFNFALNLEYLEAEFYLRASTGNGLNQNEISGTGTPGPVTGGRAVNLPTQTVRNFANELAVDERNHVNVLRAALGSNAVARPAIDLTNSFNAAAAAAGLPTPFDPFADENSFLLGSFIFEDVGVTAYKGASTLIKDPANLSGAAGILAIEAYHAGVIRTLLYQRSLGAQARAISDARDTLDGPGDMDQGIGDSITSNLAPADRFSIAFGRTTDQVLNIVYLDLTQTKKKGGFFPAGVNGRIQ